MKNKKLLKLLNKKKEGKYGTSKVLDLRKDEVLRELKKVASGIKTLEDVAKKFGVGRTTLYYWMRKNKISIQKITDEMKKELEAKLERKIRKKDLALVPPEDFDEFLSIEIVQQVKQKMMSANKTEEHINQTLLLWYYLSKGKLARANVQVYEPVHPIIPFKNFELLDKYLAKAREIGYEVNALKYKIKTIAKWLNVKLPPEFETKEYKGKYSEAELNVELRYLFLKTAKEIEQRYIKYATYEQVRASAIYLFQGGGRKESLWNTEALGWKTAKNEDIIRMYNGINRFFVYRSKEKGKEEKARHKILIPEPFVKYVIPYIPMSVGEVKKLEKAFKIIFEEMLRRYGDKMNRDTKAYLGENKNSFERKMKIFHIWRHTFAREGLRASKWNMYIISKLGKWDKVDNLKIYGDFGIDELLETHQESYLLFLYNEWLEKAVKEKLL